MSKREKNKILEKSSFLTSTNFNTKIPIMFSSTSIKNFNKNINFNKIKLIIESHNKTFHKRSHSTYQNIMTSINSQNNPTNITSSLNRFNTNTNRSKENMNIKIENNEPIETTGNNNIENKKNYSHNQTLSNFQNIKTNKSSSINNNEISKIFYRSLSPSEGSSNNKKKYLLPEKTSNKKTLVLDLDETLVHSVGGVGSNPGTPSQSDFTIKVPQINSSHDVHVMVRPHVEEFLERMSKRFELVIFTASISKYANPLLNIVDKMGYVPFRLFREHCTLINTAFVKDLSLLGRDFKDIIILDNNPTAYALNHYNGFPIKSWFDDKNDDELLKICPILEFLSYVPDVRDYIKKIVVQNKVQYDSVKQVIINYRNNLKKNIIPPECKKIYDLFTNDKCNNVYNNNNSDKIIQKSKSTKISIINPSFNNADKYYNNKKLNNFTNINIINKSTKHKRIFHFEYFNNSLNLPKQKPVKINHLNIGIIKNNLKEKKNKKKKDYISTKNTFLKKKKILINTMRYNYSKNKVLSCKNSKNTSSNFIINNINNININISNNFADNKNNMTENININNNGNSLMNKKIIFNYNNFNKSSKIKTPKFINYQKDIIDIKEFGKENAENKNELNISEKVKNSQNKIQAINLDDELKFSI
jgi:RNA polymerase II subunit A small phosphatase-like protein